MNRIQQEPVAFGLLIVGVVAIVLSLLKVNPEITAGVDAIVTAVVGFFVRGAVTPAASPPSSTPPA